MSQKTVKKVTIIAVLLLVISVFSIMAIDLLPFSGGEKDKIDNKPVNIYEGSADYGIILLSEDNTTTSTLLNSLKKTNATIVHSKFTGKDAGSATETLQSMKLNLVSD